MIFILFWVEEEEHPTHWEKYLAGRRICLCLRIIASEKNAAELPNFCLNTDIQKNSTPYSFYYR